MITSQCGNLFLEADIGGGKNVAPTVVFPYAKPDRYYTIMMVDPDADIDGSFPDATAPGSHAPVRHWVVGNIPGANLQVGDLTKNVTVSPFKGPSPPAGANALQKLRGSRFSPCLVSLPHDFSSL